MKDTYFTIKEVGITRELYRRSRLLRLFSLMGATVAWAGLIYLLFFGHMGYRIIFFGFMAIVLALDTVNEWTYRIVIDETGLEEKSLVSRRKFFPWNEVLAIRRKGALRAIEIDMTHERRIYLNLADTARCLRDIMRFVPNLTVDENIREKYGL